MHFRLKIHGNLFLSILLITVMRVNPVFADNATGNGRSDSLHRKIDSLQKILAIVNDTQKIEIFHSMATTLIFSEPEKAISFGKQALKLADNIHHLPSQAKANRDLSTLYRIKSDYKQALFHAYNALKYYEKENDKSNIAEMYSNIGAIHDRSDINSDLPRKYYLQAIALKKQLNELSGVGPIYNNLGGIEFDKKNYAKSIQYYKKALTDNHYLSDNVNLTMTNIGGVYLMLKDFEHAQYYFKEVLKSKNLNTLAEVRSYYGLGEIACIQSKYKEAEGYLFKAKTLAENGGLKEQEAEILKNIADLYIKKRDNSKALKYYMLYKEKYDAIINLETRKQMNELQAKYEAEKKDEQIKTLYKDKQLVEARYEKETTLRIFFIIAFVLIITIIIVIARNKVLRQKVKNKMLTLEKTQLQHENMQAHYKILTNKINPHFLFNNLNTLSLVVLKDQDAAVQYIEHFSELYRMILQTSNQDTISLEEEMRVVEHYLYLQKIEFGEKLIASIHIPDEQLAEFVVPPFAVQMLVENAIKHNTITRLRKLTITIIANEEFIIVSNNLQKKSYGVTSTKTGQRNITDRYTLLTPVKPQFTETEIAYIARLPLLRLNTRLNKPKEQITVLA